MDELDEKVLDIQQRQKRTQIMRRYKSKIERSREIAKKKMAPEANIRKRAFVQARQIIRRKVAGARGAEYEKLGPSEKIAIDRAVEGKQKAIKKLALRLIPRVKQAEAKRLHAFMKGQQLQNQGQKEGKTKESSGSSSVKESLNAIFMEAFPPTDTSNALGQKVDSPVTSSDKKMPPKGKSKNTEIIQFSKFDEEIEFDTPAFASLFKKSEKSGVDLETLGEVYDRGWNTWTQDCKVSQQQYAFARVNSFINQGKTYFNEDSDLHEELSDEDKARRLAIIKFYTKNKTTKVPEGRAKGVLAKGKNQFASKTIGKFNKYKGKGGSGALANTVGRKAVIGENAALDEGRAPGTPSITRYKRPDGSTALKSLNKWGKRKDWRDTEGGLAKAKEHSGADTVREDVQIDEVSKATLKSYSQKAEKQTRGNQPHGADALRKRTNREKGLKAAYNKYYGYKTKVPATEETQPKKMSDDALAGLEKEMQATRVTHKSIANLRSRIRKEEVQQTNENFIDGKGPGKPGDAARHGLKGKSAAELRKIRSSETASPRQKQLAHWMLNMHHNESVDEGLKDPKDNPCWKNYKPVGTKVKNGKTVPNCVPEAVEKVVGTNCRNCSWWKPDSEKPVTKEELNKNGGLKAPNKEYIAMSKRIDLGTLPGEDHSVKVKGFCEHEEINDWVTERMCCSQWDADGMIRDYKGQSPVMKEEGESIVPQTTSKGSKIRKKIEVVDRKPPHTEYTRQAEIKTKVIDEKVGNVQKDPKKREIGTDSLVKAYKADTPFSESLDESFNIAFAAGVGVTFTAADLGMKAQGGFALHPSVIEEMEEVEEEVRSADIKGVIVKTAAGKTVVRKQKVDRKIIGSGNVHDGEPDDTL